MADIKNKCIENGNCNSTCQNKQLKDVQHHTHHVIHQWYIYMMTINACLGTWFFGYNLGAYNAAQKIVQKINSWEQDEYTLYTAIITAAMPCGALIGAYCSKYSVDLLKGIRKSMIFFDCISILGTIILILDTTLPNLIIGRLICGFCVGQNTALIPMYVRDFTPKEIGGRVGSINQFFLASGVFSSYLVSLVLPLPINIQNGYSDQIPWRIALGIPMASPLIRLFFLSTCFKLETPSIMMKQHRYVELQQYIHTVYEQSDCEDVFHEYEEKAIADEEYMLKKKVNSGSITSVQKVENQNVNEEQCKKSENALSLAPCCNATNTQAKKKSVDDFFLEKIYELCDEYTYARRLFLGCVIQFTTQSSGVNAIVFYSNKIFKDTSGEVGEQAELQARYATIGMGAAMVSYNFISYYLQGKCGRKFLMLFGVTIIVIALFVFGGINTVTQDQALGQFGIFLIYLFQFGWQISLGAVTWILNTEILDHASVSFSSAVRWTTTMTVGLVFPYMNIYCNLYGAFFIFGGFTITALIYFIFEIKETKGKDRYEIMKAYCKPKKYQEFQLIANEYAKQAYEEQNKQQKKEENNVQIEQKKQFELQEQKS